MFPSSVVIKHNDIVHRRCRSGEDGVTDDGVDWRPMFGLSWTRTMEPTSGSLILAADGDNDDATGDPFVLTSEEASHPESSAKVAVWESIMSWIEGNGPVTSAGLGATQGMTESDVKRLGQIVQTSQSETERVGTCVLLTFDQYSYACDKLLLSGAFLAVRTHWVLPYGTPVQSVTLPWSVWSPA
jgi:hypothetical protein